MSFISAFDSYNLCLTGSIGRTLATPSGGLNEHIPVVIIGNEYRHVICFEPGIARREGSDSRFVQDVSVTLRARMGDNQPAVCYEVNNEKDNKCHAD